jgi:hypothetical protein
VLNPLVNETVPDVVGHRRRRRELLTDLLLLGPAGVGVAEQVVRELRAHQPLPSQRQGDARRVDRDPAATPLLGDEGGRSGAAGGIEDEITGIGGHEHAAFDDSREGLNDVYV